MYQSAHIIGSRQFHAQEQQRRLVENQDDHEQRMIALARRADDVDGRYGDALVRLDRAMERTNRAVEAAEAIQALRVTVARLRFALATLGVLTAGGALAALVAR